MAAMSDRGALLARPDVQYKRNLLFSFKEKCVRVRPEWEGF